jgi:hypothetical protein
VLLEIVMVCGAAVDPSPMVPKATLAGETVTPAPIPVSESCCGLLVPVSVTLRVAVRVPTAVGLKTTARVQVAEAARVEPQVFWLRMKSAALVPVKATLLIVMEAEPVLVRVALLAPPALPMLTLYQLSELGESEAPPVAPAPVPEKLTVSGMLVLLEVMLHVALSAAVVEGLKTMAAVQLADAARLEPQVVEEMAKSAAFVPEIVGALRATAAEVPFVTVMDCGELVDPWTMLPKERLVGDAPTPVPRPVRETCCGLLGALSAMARVAVRVPMFVGLKTTVMAQLAEAARATPQVFWPMRKSPGLAPVKVTLPMERLAAPLLVRVTLLPPPALPMATLYQLREVGETETAPAAA